MGVYRKPIVDPNYHGPVVDGAVLRLIWLPDERYVVNCCHGGSHKGHVTVYNLECPTEGMFCMNATGPMIEVVGRVVGRPLGTYDIVKIIRDELERDAGIDDLMMDVYRNPAVFV